MARPKTITDERILAAATEAVSELGPGITMADVAARAGVSVGTVAGRFGSKTGLWRGLMAAAEQSSVHTIRSAADAAGGGLAGLRAGLLAWFADYADPVVAANHVASLGVDLQDPVLREMLGGLFSVVEKEVRQLVRSAGLAAAPPPARAARVLVTLVNGGVLRWSVAPKGTLRGWLVADLDAVLDAWKGT